MQGSGSHVSPCTLPATALGREETLTQLCLTGTQPPPLLSPLRGAVGCLERGPGVSPPPAVVEAPGPLRAPYPAGCQGARRAAPAVAAELPARNNGAIEGLELEVRPGRPGCGLRMGRTAEPACSTPAEL